MKNYYLIFFFILITLVSNGQEKINSYGEPISTIELSKRAKELEKKYLSDIQKAKELNLVIIDTFSKDKILHFNGFAENGEALYLTTYSTTNAGKTVGANSLYSGGILGLDLNGSDDRVKDKLGMWDGGSININHQEIGERGRNIDSRSISDHSSHVAGIMISKGINSDVRGMVNGANLRAWDFNNDISELTGAAANKSDGSPGLLITNHSYGYQAGWVYDPSVNKWRWYGNTSVAKFQDYKFGQYDASAASLDRLANDAPYLLMVKSAGNNRGENGPAQGEVYFLGSGSDTSTVARLRNDGYDIISTTGNAKNILTVGAVDMNFRFPYINEDIKLSEYSSWGPTDDGRIKPDLVGVGTNLLSIGTGTKDYTLQTGTSMSSPNVAGALLLLQELNVKRNNTYLKASTIKGIALHTSHDIQEIGPDYQSGWGLLDIEKASKIILNNTLSTKIIEGTLSQGDSTSLTVIASGEGNLEASISWTDPAATAQGTVLNEKKPKLVNDLDIRIKDEDGTVYFPFILDPSKPEKAATTGDNILDNFEKIIVPNTIPGKTYTISYFHKDTLKNNRQNFSLVLSGIGGKAYCGPTFSTIAEDIDSLIIANTKNPTEAIDIELGGSDSLKIYFNNSNAKSLVFLVDWNKDGDFNDESEKVYQLNNFQNNSLNFLIEVPKSMNIFQNDLIKSRIIFVEGASIGDYCATYAKGKSLDYILKILPPSKDIEVNGLSQTGGEFCPTDGESDFYVKVKNNGSANRDGFKVRLNISQNNTLIGSFESETSSLLRGTENEISIATDLSLSTGGTYQYRVELVDEEDQNLSNNTYSTTQTIRSAVSPVTEGFSCEGTENFVLRSLDGRSVNWTMEDGSLIGIGTEIKASGLKNPLASIGNLSFKMGPGSKTDFGGGTYYENFGPAPVFEVESPIILEKTTIYTGTAGTIYFELYNYDTGELVSSIAKNVPATRSADTSRVNNQIIEDFNDPGIELTLNLRFPEAGNYILFQTCTNGASIYRSNIPKGGTTTLPQGGDIGYPYEKDKVIKLIGALYNGELIKTGYYYFYNTHFISPGCKSENIPVNINQAASPTITINPSGTNAICSGAVGDTLRITDKSANADILWFFNDIATQNTSDSLISRNPGVYYAVATNKEGCFTNSEKYNLEIDTPEIPKLALKNGYISASYGETFQWYLDGFPIDGATEQRYLATESGNYFVLVTNEKGCNAKSITYELNILATEIEEPNYTFNLFPNPTNKKIHLRVPNEIAEKGFNYKIFDLQGSTMIENRIIQKEKEVEIDISRFANGIYFLMVPELPINKVIKFIKE